MNRHASTAVAATLICGAALAADSITSLRATSVEIPGSVGIVMKLIPAGSFVMGSPEDEVARGKDEAQHMVRISRPFYMAETEITQDQYLPVMSPNYKPMFIRAAHYDHSLPEVHQGGPIITESKYLGPTHKNPMDGVTWSKAMAFCRILTAKERAAGRLPGGYEYRLPTEAEWEYACRAGTTGPFGVDGRLPQFSWGPDVPTLKWTSPVKRRRKPNAWGLYDMHGNVYEWCLDWYGPYPSTPSGKAKDQVDPTGPVAGEQRVARGGSWGSGRPQGDDRSDAVRLRYMRSASRNRFPPQRLYPIVGFRVALAPAVRR